MLNPRNLGNNDKPRRLESNDGMMMTGNRGGGYRGGSSNFAAGALELGFSSLGMDDFGGKRGYAQIQGANCEMGFTGLTQSQVDNLFALFKERQNQEKVEKMSGKSFNITPMQWVFDSVHLTI